MADPLLFPDNAAAKLRQLEDRIRVLETSNKLLASTILGGSLRVLNSSGIPVVVIGDLPDDTSGVYTGIRLYNSAGTLPILQADQTHGFGVPWISSGWREYFASTIVTAGTFTTTYTTLTELLYSTQMLFRVAVIVDAATTGEMQLYHGNGAAVLGSVKTLPAGTNVNYEYRMTHGITIGTGPQEFFLQVRRTSGAGNISVFEPGPLHFGSNMSTVAGGWV